jgi:hypothetical protein
MKDTNLSGFPILPETPQGGRYSGRVDIRGCGAHNLAAFGQSFGSDPPRLANFGRRDEPEPHIW